MNEYFIVSNSFAAPFFSDTNQQFVKGNDPEDAMDKFVRGYKHPCGLYAAYIYEDANSYHKGEKPLLKWLCNHEIKKHEVTKDKGGYTYLGNGPGNFEVNGENVKVDNPKKGKILKEE